MIERKKCINCGAEYKVDHDLPEEDYIEKYCPFCGEEQEVVDELADVEKRYETEVNTYQGKLSKISNELEKDCFKMNNAYACSSGWFQSLFRERVKVQSIRNRTFNSESA